MTICGNCGENARDCVCAEHDYAPRDVPDYEPPDSEAGEDEHLEPEEARARTTLHTHITQPLAAIDAGDVVPDELEMVALALAIQAEGGTQGIKGYRAMKLTTVVRIMLVILPIRGVLVSISHNWAMVENSAALSNLWVKIDLGCEWWKRLEYDEIYDMIHVMAERGVFNLAMFHSNAASVRSGVSV